MVDLTIGADLTAEDVNRVIDGIRAARSLEPTRSRLLPVWLEDAARECETRAVSAASQYLQLRNQTTPYAEAIVAIAEAHKEAAEVYRRRLRELLGSD